MKKILTVFLLTVMASTLSPVAFAGNSDVPLDSAALDTTLTPIPEETKMADPSVMPYYAPISFTVGVSSKIKASKVFISADYNVNTLDSREAISVKLGTKYNEVKAAFSKYGKVTRSYISIYEDYVDPYATSIKSKTYSGSLSIRVDLTNISNYQTVQDELIAIELNAYPNVEINEEDKIDLESSLADKINALIKKKKKTYEKILEKSLGKITNLYLDTWPDPNDFDPETGMVKVTVNATVNY
ncbi:MAG: hypothetical protein WC806_05010 [Candidatus Gracilibacteria bacterium]|jgi:hypothetical protein